MRRLSLLIVAALLSLPSCNAISGLFASNTVAQPEPFVQSVPDSIPTPEVTENGWKPVRSTPTEIIWLPPLAQPVPVWVKLKNVGNTNTRRSNNTGSYNDSKKSGNTKAKGEGIVGDKNAPVQAKKQAVVGDGNSVEQVEKGQPWWVWLPAVLVLLALYWIGRRLLPL